MRANSSSERGAFSAMTRSSSRLPADRILANDSVEVNQTFGASFATRRSPPQVYLRKEELDALRKAAARSGRSVAEVVRDAIRKVVLKPNAAGPVAIWDGEPKRASIEHDSVHDEP
jgi:ribbon-helix-helix CopG family protein